MTAAEAADLKQGQPVFWTENTQHQWGQPALWELRSGLFVLHCDAPNNIGVVITDRPNNAYTQRMESGLVGLTPHDAVSNRHAAIFAEHADVDAKLRDLHAQLDAKCQ